MGMRNERPGNEREFSSCILNRALFTDLFPKLRRIHSRGAFLIPTFCRMLECLQSYKRKDRHVVWAAVSRSDVRVGLPLLDEPAEKVQAERNAKYCAVEQETEALLKEPHDQRHEVSPFALLTPDIYGMQ